MGAMTEQEAQKKRTEMPKQRTAIFEVRAAELTQEQTEEGKMVVEGYAAVFESETVLFEWDGVEYKEIIDRNAFSEAKMDDVIFNYDHQGRVMARTRNKTLQVSVDDRGLFIRAELQGTQEGRSLYEDIKGGYVDRMSYRYTVQEESYDSTEHRWRLLKVKRLYDVSAVSIPAYDDTSIEARKNFILEAGAQEKREREAAADLRKRKLVLQNKIMQNLQRKGEE